MIKNPKLGQKVFYVGDNEEVFSGELTQIYCNGTSYGVNNHLYLNNEYLFATKKRAERYSFCLKEWRNLDSQISKLHTKRQTYSQELHKLRQ